jgi:hypothetical protein
MQTTATKPKKEDPKMPSQMQKFFKSTKPQNKPKTALEEILAKRQAQFGCQVVWVAPKER